MAGYQKKLWIIGSIVLILLFILLFWVGYYNKMHPKLSHFKITRVEELDNELVLFFRESKHAEKYIVHVTDSYGNLLYEETTTNKEVVLKDFTVDYNEDILVSVSAIGKNDEVRNSDNTYIYKWREPTISETSGHYVAGGKDFVVYMDGMQENSAVKLRISYQNRIIHEQDIRSNTIVIPYQILKDYSGRLTFQVVKNDDWIIDTYNVYINTTLVGNVEILSPSEGFTKYDDIVFSYSGGGSATHFKLNIYEGKKKINTITLISKQTTISGQYFEPSKEYRLELKAIYEDYEEIAKTAEVKINMGTKQTTNPVYTNYNWKNIKSGTRVILASRTNNVKIYYTTDGSDPKKNGILYQEPITISNDITLKTYATNKNMYDSEVNTYAFHVGWKRPIIYLSPSNQSKNFGISKVGYTTEMEMMNQVGDVVEKKLKAAGVIVYRNNPDTDINAWMSESKKVGSDFHFAIHSNASVNHNRKGMEIFVNHPTSCALSVATNIYEDLYQIYPYKNSETNIGVRFANDAYGEVKTNAVACTSLIEIAFHDDENDAKWIVNNIEKIGTTLANSIIKFYQVGA